MKFSPSMSGLATVFLIGTLTACETIPAAQAEPVDIDAMIAMLPEGIAASYDAVNYDGTSGNTIVSNFRLTSTDNTEIGVIMEELIVSGFDEAFVQARIDGTNFPDTGVIFDTLEARNTSLFGVETFYGGLTEAYIDALSEAVEDIGEEGELSQAFDEASENAFEKLDFRIASMAIDDLTLLPFEPPASGEGADEGLSALQTFFAQYRAVGANSWVMDGLVYDMELVAEGEPIDMLINVDETAVYDWAGGDVGRSVLKGVTYDMIVPLDEDDELNMENVSITGSIETLEVSDFFLDDAYGWLVKGELPSPEVTDLISLGVWKASGEEYTMFGAPFYSVDSYELDLSGFHWFVPTKLDIKYDNLTYDMGSLLTNIFEAIPDADLDEDSEEVLQILEILEPYGLTAPTLDMTMSWRYDAEAGPGSMGLEFAMENYGRLTLDMDGSLADFATLYAAFTNDSEDGPDPQAVLAATSSLANFSIEMEDFGGIDNMLAILIDVAKAQPDNPQLAPLAGFEPAGLKGMMTGMIALSIPQIAAEFPEVQGYATALTSYISQGGTLRVELDPESPIDLGAVMGMQALGSPSAMAEQAGLKVTHTPPAAQ